MSLLLFTRENWDTLIYVYGILSGIVAALVAGYKSVSKLVEERSVGRKKVKELEAAIEELNVDIERHDKRILQLERQSAMSEADKQKVRELREDVRQMRTLIYDLVGHKVNNDG